MQEGLEESSWTMYFETEDGLGHYDDSSMMSDAASPMGCVEEDTASSPSNRTEGYSGMEDNTIEEKTMNNGKIEVRNFMFSNISFHK
jgi:hypothetical protein